MNASANLLGSHFKAGVDMTDGNLARNPEYKEEEAPNHPEAKHFPQSPSCSMHTALSATKKHMLSGERPERKEGCELEFSNRALAKASFQALKCLYI